MAQQPDRVDVLVIGGGTAGCVLAARLSEDPGRRVMLVEAGRDTPPGAVPPDIADPFPLSYANPSYFTPAERTVGADGAHGEGFTQPRVMGGGSSVMGLWAVRGLPDDYDGWESGGARGWGFADVLPFFKRLERDFDFGGDLHGASGPTPLSRVPVDSWPGFQRAVAQAAGSRGLEFFPDIHAHHGDGVYPLPNSTDGKTRASAVECYLTATVRARRNLEIRSDTQALALICRDRLVTGARVRRADGVEEIIQGTTVVVCCGAIHSPALLLRSGIGAAAHLRECGIRPVQDLPGVGANLHNHVVVHLGGLVRPHARQSPELRNYAMACIRASSRIEGGSASDLFFGLISRTGARARDNGIGLIAAGLYAPLSRGRVSLQPTNPAGPAHVDFQALADPIDAARMIRAAAFANELLHADPVRDLLLETFVLPKKLPIRRLNAPGILPAIGSAALGRLDTLPGPLRRGVLAAGIGPGRMLRRQNPEDGSFERLVLASSTPMFHPAGTCAIGTVVDPSTQVRGIGGLFVIDASIMPRVPRANTNLPTLMVAERGAALVQEVLRG